MDECKVDGLPLEEFLMQNQSKHEFIRKNLLNATLNFQHRVKTFMQKIVMSKLNPMCVQYNSYKVEFAFRGAAHVHGVLWVDLENCKAVPDETIMVDDEETTISHMERIRSVIDDIKNDHYEKNVTEENLESLVKFVDEFVTVSLMDPVIEELVRLVNCHHHTRTCRKYGCKCRFYFPKFPSMRTIISIPARLKFKDMKPEDSEKKTEELQTILKKVKEVLEDEQIMETLEKIEEDEIEDYKIGSRSEEQLEESKRVRLEALLEVAKVERGFPNMKRL